MTPIGSSSGKSFQSTRYLTHEYPDKSIRVDSLSHQHNDYSTSVTHFERGLIFENVEKLSEFDADIFTQTASKNELGLSEYLLKNKLQSQVMNCTKKPLSMYKPINSGQDIQIQTIVDKSLAPFLSISIIDIVSDYDEELELTEENLKAILVTDDVSMKRKFIRGAIEQRKTNVLNKVFCDLRTAGIRPNLSRVDLSGLDLSKIDFSHTNLRHANLNGSNLTNGMLIRADLSYADLAYATLTHAHLERAKLVCTDLTFADCDYADLTDSTLTKAILTGTKLRYVWLVRADLSDAIMIRANLNYARLHEANLTNTKLRHASLISATLYATNLKATCLEFANLTKSELSRAILTDTNLKFSLLTDAYLGGAAFMNVSLQGANLAGTKLTGATYDGADMTREAPKWVQFQRFINLDIPTRRRNGIEESLKKELPCSIIDTVCDYAQCSEIRKMETVAEKLKSQPLGAPLEDLTRPNFEYGQLTMEKLDDYIAVLNSDDFSAKGNMIRSAHRNSFGTMHYNNASVLARIFQKMRSIGNINLAYVNLSGMNFESFMTYTDFFDGVDLQWADLNHTNLSQIFFKNSNLFSTNLNGANLKTTYFCNNFMPFAKMNRSNLTDAQIESCVLYGADLRNAELYKADLRKVNLAAANLTGASSIVQHVPSKGSQKLSQDEWSSFRIFDSDLTSANLKGARLRNAIISRTELSEVDWAGSNLVDAVLNGKMISNLRWNGTNQTDAFLSSVPVVVNKDVASNHAACISASA